MNAFVYAQVPETNVRAHSMGGSSVAAGNYEGITENPAIIPISKGLVVASGVMNKYNLKELAIASLKIQKKIKGNQVISISVNKFGNKSFSQQTFSAAIGSRLGQKISAGIQIHCVNRLLKDSYYENSKTAIPEIGIHSNPLENIYFGAIVRNPVRVRMNANENQKLPAEIITGVAVKISNKLLLQTSAQQASTGTLTLLTGFEYVYHECFILRGGYHTEPMSPSFGISLKLKKYILNLSFSENHPLGITSAIELILSL